MTTHRKRGSVLIEALVAVSVLGVIAYGYIGLFYPMQFMGRILLQQQKARWLALEGMEAMLTIGVDGLPLSGTGKIFWNGTGWEFIAGQPEQTADGFTREIGVAQVRRNEQCQVDVMGTSDPDSRTLTSVVSWVDASGSDRALDFIRHVVDWQDPQGDCFLPQAQRVDVDFLAGAWSGQKQLRGVYVRNTGGTNVTIDRIVLTWSNAAAIQQLFLGESKLWSSSGPGSPSGNQPSGTELDIANEPIPSGGEREINKVQFTQNMTGTTLTMKLIFEDGSFVESGAFVPSF